MPWRPLLEICREVERLPVRLNPAAAKELKLFFANRLDLTVGQISDGDLSKVIKSTTLQRLEDVINDAVFTVDEFRGESMFGAPQPVDERGFEVPREGVVEYQHFAVKTNFEPVVADAFDGLTQKKFSTIQTYASVLEKIGDVL